jgi:hypothetical protein
MRTVATYQEVLRSRVLINEIRIEYVELVTLHNLRGRVVHIVVGLIVLVPFKTGVYPARERQHELDGKCMPCRTASINLKEGTLLDKRSAANNFMSLFLCKLYITLH